MKKFLLPFVIILHWATLPAQSIVADYDFNPSLRDNSVNGNHLMLYGTGSSMLFATPGSTGVNSDTCGSFTAQQGLVSTQAIENTNWTGTSISFWTQSMSQNAVSTSGFILQGAYSGFGIKMYYGSFVSFFGGTSVGVPASNFAFSISNLGWHHVVAQNNGDSTFIYVDGLLDKAYPEQLYHATGPNANAKMYIGTAVTDLSSDKLDGVAVDELMVFDFFLSPAQRSQLILHQDPTIVTTVNHTQTLGHSLSPNPSAGQVNLRFMRPFETATIVVRNSLGQSLFTYTTSEMADSLELPSEAGIYLIEVTVDGVSSSHKVVRL